jgi:hypothetical protein
MRGNERETRDPYRAEGHENRAAYLRALAEQFGLPLSTVLLTAAMLGPSEDFDGLVTTLEDADLDGL